MIIKIASEKKSVLLMSLQIPALSSQTVQP